MTSRLTLPSPARAPTGALNCLCSVLPLPPPHSWLALYPTATRPKLKKMKSQTGQVGEKQSLKCEAAAGNPQPSYRWFKDGKELNRSRDIRIKYGNGR